MNSISIDSGRCPKNHFCPVIPVCPVGAISQSTPFSAPVIDDEKCIQCGKCTKYCGYRAFQKN